VQGDRPQTRRPRHRWSDIERELRRSGRTLIAGVDEVGRGPLAGPVVACAIIMPPDLRAIAGVDDSKELTREVRERLVVRIRERALAIGVGAASVGEIDRLNIARATAVAMNRAIRRLGLAPDHIVIDGIEVRTLGIAHMAVIDGDAKCYCVACASIVAKVVRDALMRRLAIRHPRYGWETNVGYGTPEHTAALFEHGPTKHHRRSFLPVRQLSLL
jgi:ribonuclease HII